MTNTPTDADLRALVGGPLQDLHPLVRVWLKPVDGLLPVLADTQDKPLAELTVTEAIAWGATIAYIATSTALATQLAAGVLASAVRR